MKLITICLACALFALSSVKAEAPAQPAAALVVAAAANEEPLISAAGLKKIDPSLYPSQEELEERINTFNAYVAHTEDKKEDKQEKKVAGEKKKKAAPEKKAAEIKKAALQAAQKQKLAEKKATLQAAQKQ
ncbi:hypothetical protein BG006_007637, partial [Podila minutissima]